MNEISNRLNLRKIKFAIQKCSLRELAWFCQAGACLDQRSNDLFNNDRSAVATDLDNMLARV
jgi:hypothetical protein